MVSCTQLERISSVEGFDSSLDEGRLLRQCKGSLELIDVSSMLPEFKRQAGLRSWSVRSSKGSWFTKLAEADQVCKFSPTTSMPPYSYSHAMSMLGF